MKTVQILAGALIAVVSIGCGAKVSLGGATVSGQPASGLTGVGGQPASGSTAASTAGVGSGGASATSDGGVCAFVGTWDGISGIDGTNASTKASYAFNADGTWTGGQYGADPVATEFMHGTYALQGDVFDLLTGCGMGPQCPCNDPATYSVALDPGCAQMTLYTQTDGCTGARLYLNASPDGTVLTKRP